MTPQTAALRLGLSLLTGGALGIWYDFLRPLRPQRTWLADGLFSLGALWSMVWFMLAVCRGDLRQVYVVGAPVGILLWESTASRLFRPIWKGFWTLAAKIWHLLLVPGKKSWKFAKKMFASAEKWVTIEWHSYWKRYVKPGGKIHERKEESAEECKDRGSPQFPGAEDRVDRGYRVLYRGTGGTADCP